MGSKPTIQTVAQMAGVSRGTVDRVLNGRAHVREDVRLRVLEAIRHAGLTDCVVVVTRYFGGILLGLIEILAKAYISTQLSDAIVFSVLIIVLLVKPTGLLGKKITAKV